MTEAKKLREKLNILTRMVGMLTDTLLELVADDPPSFHRLLREMEQFTDDLDALNAPSRKDQEVLELYLYWQAYHPQARRTPRPSDVSKLRGRIREDGVAICKMVVDYIHKAPDAKWWRDQGRLSIATLFKPDKWGSRADAAIIWDKNGRPTEPKPDPKSGIDWKQRAADNVVEFPG